MNSEHSCEPVTISERELEILQLVAQGLTTKQIAEKVHLSFHTVMTHRKNMMGKLGINNTAGLIIYAVRENLISPNRFLFSESKSTS
jgi:DNA-binding NarL/FixJ family response regulator